MLFVIQPTFDASSVVAMDACARIAPSFASNPHRRRCVEGNGRDGARIVMGAACARRWVGGACCTPPLLVPPFADPRRLAATPALGVEGLAATLQVLEEARAAVRLDAPLEVARLSQL